MNKDKKTLYVISSVIFALLLAALFIDTNNSRLITACLLTPLCVAVCLLIRKRRSLSIDKKEVLLFTTVIGIIYIVLFQLTGIFFGFYKNPYFVSVNTFLTTVLPLVAIIIAIEIIRCIILMQNDRLTSIITFVSCVIADMLMYSSLSAIASFNRFMDLVGLTLFPAITSNVYYHYVSKRFGAVPNIVFRLISTIYIYFIPSSSGIPDALAACIKMIFPLVLLALTSALFDKQKKKAIRKGEKVGTVALVLSTVFVISVAMLISCQFRFGALIIATESMTGEINKGDMIIYEKYGNQHIEEGQVIVFLQNDSRIIHRVVKIEHEGNETRYYTKGDANEVLDDGYRTETDIIGLTDIKIAYVGFPTLWIRELINSNN